VSMCWCPVGHILATPVCVCVYGGVLVHVCVCIGTLSCVYASTRACMHVRASARFQ